MSLGPQAKFRDASNVAQDVSPSQPLPVSEARVAVGSLTWGAAVAVVSDGASKTLIAANAGRRALTITNPEANAKMAYEPSGGAATLDGSEGLLGGDKDTYLGAACPTGLVTFIGTSGQTLYVREGT